MSEEGSGEGIANVACPQSAPDDVEFGEDESEYGFLIQFKPPVDNV